MTINENIISEIVARVLSEIIDEEHAVLINRRKWEWLNYEEGERVLECNPKSIIICSDDCSIRLSATKRYDHPDNMNPANGWYNNYWKFLGWEVNAITYRNGKWEVFDSSFPRKFKSKSEVLNFIKRTRSFNLAKKELKI